ncbi:MAG: hypothetical protein GY719_35840 [bacterium]|nr:hypothetical protein [bacterium]
MGQEARVYPVRKKCARPTARTVILAAAFTLLAGGMASSRSIAASASNDIVTRAADDLWRAYQLPRVGNLWNDWISIDLWSDPS